MKNLLTTAFIVLAMIFIISGAYKAGQSSGCKENYIITDEVATRYLNIYMPKTEQEQLIYEYIVYDEELPEGVKTNFKTQE